MSEVPLYMQPHRGCVRAGPSNLIIAKGPRDRSLLTLSRLSLSPLSLPPLSLVSLSLASLSLASLSRLSPSPLSLSTAVQGNATDAIVALPYSRAMPRVPWWS